ncbi:conserved hypothetical protein [Talaromyces stipitatus ATCC 10500]|uniref:Uncharacterized protein n=1 Tax=Talaromyces stipitatus (strain ATCC 10500 / CBS 375.48 / QM 6759 / NRRL 1006) TaxID=441959 RepID=B8MHH8_TALSN|nr:uncharacterized protein TSTA_010750 [Talaromyces stipitatus ATCC 10500]EED15959.1 conserved hypothetical protein [Talaromyces stipitatus ATCC 10500]
MASDARRFKPELVESSSRSRRSQNTHHADKSRAPVNSPSSTALTDSSIANVDERRFTDKAITLSTGPGKPRRFLPQPMETSSRSSKKQSDAPRHSHGNEGLIHLPGAPWMGNNLPSGQRARPLPQPVENNSEPGKETTKVVNSARAPRRFFPEPVETMKLSRRHLAKTDEHEASSSPGQNISTCQTTPRKFAPQLIETGTRSVRRAETLPIPGSPRVLDDSFPANSPPLQPHSPPASRSQQIVAANELSMVPAESRFSYASLLQQQEGRRHSFRVPDLPAIPSNSSESSDDSGTPSLSTTPSDSSEGSTRNRFIAKTRSRESCDERFSGYLLSLAARSAEKELRDQALAAFPNEQVHQPVAHFAIDGDEEFGNEDDEIMAVEPQIVSRIRPLLRRGSTADLPWELEQMRRHKEKAEMKNLGVKKIDAHESKFSAAAIASRQPKIPENEAAVFPAWRRDIELVQMRHAASPPMLGDDIVFPFSVSPQGTATETDHLHINHTDSETAGDADHGGGLWTDHMHAEHEETPGLWMGLCLKDGEDEEDSHLPRTRTGIATPRPASGLRSTFDSDNMVDDEVLSVSDISEMSSDPLDAMDVEPDEDNAIEREFHDGFVTQVYNYLSLGYPSLARYFDHELSKISGIPVSDLRKDDLLADAKGYVVCVTSDKNGNTSATPENCMRWKALKLYIHEWARQQSGTGIFNDEELDAWGVIERRGSWAI